MNAALNQEPLDNDTLLRVKGLKVHFPITRGFFNRQVGCVKAVDGLNLSVRQGETLSLVGESGCGKTTTGRAILRIYKPTAGEMAYRLPNGGEVDLARLEGANLKHMRRDIRMIFQDPYASLNPRLTILEIVGQPLKIAGVAKGRELQDRVAELLRKVGLRPEFLRRYPHAFSGGQRQRIGIARALSLNPRLVVADEAVSALDVSVQAQTLNLLQDLQDEFGLTYIFIAHDLTVVEHISDRVAVMYVGNIVEQANTAAVFAAPRHPYTEALLSAAPIPDPRLRQRERRIRLPGEVADPANPPSGCVFHPRCRFADDRCRREKPELRDLGDGHMVACLHAEKLSLRGVID